jgi:small subunit ribosomal protein S8
MHYDLLAKIKNAYMAKNEGFQTAYSTGDFAIAKILARHKYIKDAQKRVIDKKQYIDIKLLYGGDDAAPAFEDFRIKSKPSRRLYTSYRELRPVRQNYGLGILSTPRGIMTTSEARKNKVGGEYLLEIW